MTIEGSKKRRLKVKIQERTRRGTNAARMAFRRVSLDMTVTMINKYYTR